MVEIRDITDEADFDRVISTATDTTTVVLNFFATWAAPCTQMRTILTTLASSYADSAPVIFLNLDAEELIDISERYQVSSVPFVVLVKAGTVVETVNGSDAGKVREAIERQAGKASATTQKVKTSVAPIPPLQKVQEPYRPPAVSSLGPSGPSTDGSSTKDRSGHAPNANGPSKVTEETTTANTKEELNARLSALVKAAPVMLFMKGTPSSPQCGFSRQLVGLLRERGVRYGFFNILADDEVRQGLKEFSDWPTFPQLYVDGELVGGLDIVQEEISTDSNFLMNYAVKPGHVESTSP